MSNSAPPMLGAGLDPQLREDLEAVSASTRLDEGGGASPLKVLLLAELIISRQLSRIVEIGVYRGRLFLPLARLMSKLGRGEMVGIDPYSVAAAVQRDVERDGIDLLAWPETVDWDGIYAEVLAGIERWQLGDFARLIRTTSEEAAPGFAEQPIDLLHVDGNHDRAAVTRDVEDFLPHMRDGGLLVMDDVGWPSVRPVFDELAQRHEVLFMLVENGVELHPGLANDFAILAVRQAPSTRT